MSKRINFSSRVLPAALFFLAGCGASSTPMVRLARYGQTAEMMEWLQDNPQISPTEIDRALISAADAGKKEAVELLLEKGADVNRAISTDEVDSFYFGKQRWVTALSIACYNGHAETARLLISRGASVNSAPNQGRTPLMMAASGQGRADLVRLLLDAGADINAKEPGGWTALIYAAHYNKPDVARLLLERGADHQAKTKDGFTALTMAGRAPHSHREILRLLKKAVGQE